MLRLRRIAAIILAILAVAALVPCNAAEKPNATLRQGSGCEVEKTTTDGEQDYLASLGLPEDGTEAKTQEKEPNGFVTAIGFIFKLALVLGLCYVTMLGLKKFTSMRGVASGPSRSHIRVIEHSSLGANRALHVVEIGTKKLLVASTPNQVNLLTELDPNDMPDPGPDARPTGFKEQLSQFLGTKPDSTNNANNVANMLRDSSSFFQDKVREVAGFRGTFRNAE